MNRSVAAVVFWRPLVKGWSKTLKKVKNGSILWQLPALLPAAPMPITKPRAVFLSYASEDADVARRICGALQRIGAEVWFEDGERGGDAWEAKTRQQIRDCALFLPLISANTGEKCEGCFRTEWKLAADRSLRQPKGAPFINPVLIDFTNERGTPVPEAFLAVKWIRLLGRDIPMAFALRLMELAAGATETVGANADSAAKPTAVVPSVTPKEEAPRAWLGWGIGAVAAVLILAFGCSRR